MSDRRVPLPVMAVVTAVAGAAAYVFGGKAGRDFVRSFFVGGKRRPGDGGGIV